MRIGIDISQIAYEHTGVAGYLKRLVEELLRIDKENEYVLFFSSLRKKTQNSKLKTQNYLSTLSSRPKGNSKFKNYDNSIIVAYEPLFAIGSGHPDTPVNANEFAKSIKNELGDIPVLYGGSVKSDNVKSFTSMPHIGGVLVGGASLDPLEFLKIIKNA